MGKRHKVKFGRSRKKIKLDNIMRIALKNKDLGNRHFVKQYNMSIALKDKFKKNLIMYERLYGRDDFRTELISIPFNSIVMQIFQFKANVYTYYNHKWWKEVNIPKHARNGFARRMENSIYFLNFIHFLSFVESCLRKLIIIFRQEECNNGKSDFYCIYDKILTDLNLSENKAVFSFAKEVRNSIHNNGFYRPIRSDQDQIMEFNGNEYTFRHNEPIDFFTPEMAVKIEDLIMECLVKIVEHDEIKKL